MIGTVRAREREFSSAPTGRATECLCEITNLVCRVTMMTRKTNRDFHRRLFSDNNVFEYEHFVISVWLKVFEQHKGPVHA